MTEFKREDRYLVLKRKDLERLPVLLQETLWQFLDDAEFALPQRHYVVVESDWPEYEAVFKMIESRVTGKSSSTGCSKAIDAELQQSVEPVLWITDLDDPIICKTEFETATFCEDDQRPIPVYLHPPQQATVKQYLKVGDSRFESWYSELNQASKGSKQIAREAYEAGLNEAHHGIGGEA